MHVFALQRYATAGSRAVRAALLSVTVLGLTLARLAAEQVPSTEDVAHSTAGQAASAAPTGLSLIPGGAAIDKAFDSDPALASIVSGQDSPEYRWFIWKLLAPADRDAIDKAVAALPQGKKLKATALLASADQFLYDRTFRYPPELQALVVSQLGLSHDVFLPTGELVPTAQVVGAQHRIARIAFDFYRSAQRNPFLEQGPRFEVLTDTATSTDLAVDDERERLQSLAPFVLDAATRQRADKATPDEAAMRALARREALRAKAEGRPAALLPDAKEAARRLGWAKGLLKAHGLLDPAGQEGLSGLLLGGFHDPLVFEALDTLHRYALEGDTLLPSATFPRTQNRVQLLFGHHDPELMQIYAGIEAMMDEAQSALWVDLYYLGGTFDQPVGQENMGIRLLRYLQKRKAQGLDVRLLLSPRGTDFTNPATYDEAQRTLGALPYKLAALPGGMPTKLDHDKLIVVDRGRAAMIGTMNFDAIPGGRGGHHETVALVHGPAAAFLAWSHLTSWRLAGGTEGAGDVAAIRQAAATDPGPARPEEALAPVWVTLTHPVVENTSSRLLDWIETTAPGEQIRIWMYQLGDHTVVDGLAAAIRRGVIVRLMADPYSGPIPKLTSIPNAAAFVPLVDAAAAAHDTVSAVKVLDRDVLGTYLHSKVAVFGTDRFTLGSTNWTHVGFHRNAELSIFVESAPLAARLIQRFEDDWGQVAGGVPVFPTLDQFRAKHPSYGMDAGALDRVRRLMDEFF